MVIIMNFATGSGFLNFNTLQCTKYSSTHILRFHRYPSKTALKLTFYL